MTAGVVARLSQNAGKGRINAYDGTAKFLHWTVAALVTIQYATKLVPVDALRAFTEDRLDTWHVGIGPTILALMAVRLAWRMTHRVPSSPVDLSPALRLVSRATHWLIYAILLLLSVLGWIAASGYGMTSYLLGLIPVPLLITPNERLGGHVGQVHGILAWALLAVIALHVAGALHHALVKKDGVLDRMLPS